MRKLIILFLTIPFIASSTLSAKNSNNMKENDNPQKIDVKFQNRAIEMAGHLYLPANFDENRKYQAIVISHQGTSCKEQSAAIYADNLARIGFITLAYDASHQGESGGEPRFIEDPAQRIQDIRSAVDYLVSLPYIDSERIGALGICAGGGYTVNTAMTDRRIKAVGTVSGACLGRFNRGNDAQAAINLLEEVGKQRTAEINGAEIKLTPTRVESTDGLTDIDYIEAYDYYVTPRGHHPNALKAQRFISTANLIGYDSFHLVETLLTQPLLIITGDKEGAFGSTVTGKELYERAASKDKDLFVVENASHIDLYDKPFYVNQAVEKLSDFYKRNL